MHDLPAKPHSHGRNYNDPHERRSNRKRRAHGQEEDRPRSSRDRHREWDRYREWDREKYRDMDRHRDRDEGRNRERDGARHKNENQRRGSHHERDWEEERQMNIKQGSVQEAAANNTAFEEGNDFIAFLPTPPSSPLLASSTDGKGKEKEREHARSNSTREWDREKPYSAYAMVFDFADANNSTYGVRSASRKAPWIWDMPWERCSNVAELMHREVEAFLHYISPTSMEDELRGLVVELVSRAISRAFPDATVHPFGSYATKLYLPSGDIDLVISSQVMANSRKENTLYHLANAVKRAGLASKVTIIAKAKVPIVKFVTTEAYGRFSVDMSVNQPNGVIAGQVVNDFLDNKMWSAKGEGKALRSLVMITKAFLAQRGMNEVFTGGLGSYTIVCLAISFLQLHPKIRRGEIDPERNLGVLMMEFFELYGWAFNYEDVGISIRDGGRYFGKVERGWDEPDWKKRSLLSVEDPVDPSNDISKGTYNISKVRQTLRGAYEIMTASAYAQASILHARRSGQSFSLRDHYGYPPEEMSILSRFMWISQETINHRRLIREVFEKRTLHDAVGVHPSLPAISLTTTRVHGTAHKGAGLDEGLGEADMETDSDEEWQRGRHQDGAGNSRHEMGKGDFPRKRQKLRNGTWQQALSTHTVFTTDDDEEGAVSDVDLVDRASDENEEIGRTTSISRKRQRYWLSKGHGEDGSEKS